MKKLLFLLLILNLNIYALNINISGAVQNGKYASTSSTIDLVSGSKSTETYVNPIYKVNVEFVEPLNYGSLGLGLSYESGYQRQNGEESFSTIPVYGIGELKMGPLFLNLKYGTTFYVGVSDGTEYTNGQYLQGGVGLIADNGFTLEGTLNASTAKRNGQAVGSVTYGLSLGGTIY